jgi:octaprenyl-diphosphate synthase
VAAAATFGQQLGIAYQIYDDLVDFFGEEAKIGKTLGTDLDSGKLTLPLFELADCLSAEEKRFLMEEITGKRPPDMPLRLSQMRNFPIFDRVNERLESHLRSAEAALQPFTGKPAVARLETLLEVLRSQVAGLRLVKTA